MIFARVLLAVASAATMVALNAEAANAGATYANWEADTVSGKTMQIFYASEVKPNCSFLVYPSAQILSAPAHGSTSLKKQKVFPNYDRGNSLSKCNSTSTKGIAIYYTPANKFVGSDRVKLRVKFSDGRVNEITVRIKVL